MSRETTLVKNTIVYMIGNFASRFLGFLLLPLYTNYLSKADYGFYDLILVAALILVPVITLQINDSIYRYLLEAKDENEISKIVTNALVVIFGGILVFTPLYFLFIKFYYIKYSVLIVIFVVVNILQIMYQQIARGVKMNVVYSISGVIYTFVMLISNIVLVIIFDKKVDGLIYSNILSCLAVVIFLQAKINIIKKIKLSIIDTGFIKQLIKYSMPLLPNSISWWIMVTSSRYFIKYFLGISANGVFAVSLKFPGLMVMVNTLFYLAWQESAIDEYGSKDKDAFYTKMFNIYMITQMTALFFLIPATKIVMTIFVKNEFFEAWQYIPVLYLGTAFSAFSSFYGTGYLSSKDTIGAFTTSLIGAIINLVVNLILMPVIGLQAASIASTMAFLIMWIVRLFQTRKYFIIKVEWKKFFVLLFIIGGYTVAYYFDILLLDIIMTVISLPIIFVFNRNFIKRMWNFVKNVINKRKAAVS